MGSSNRAVPHVGAGRDGSPYTSPRRTSALTDRRFGADEPAQPGICDYPVCQTGWPLRFSEPFGGMVVDVHDERDLARRCAAGSEAAYAELVLSHRPRLYLLAYRLTGDRQTAEDVVQETFLAAFRSIEKVEPRPSLSPWLNTVLLRIARRAALRQRLRRASSLDQPALGHPSAPFEQDGAMAAWLVDSRTAADPHAAAETAELRRALAAAIAALPYKYRAAVVLRYVMGFEYVEAATQLEIPLNTLKSHLLRGVRMLRDALAEQLEAPGLEECPPPGPTATVAERAGASGASTKRGGVGVTSD